MVPLFANFTKDIEKSELLNGANITGSILKTGENMVDFYDEMFTFVKMLLTGIILMLVIVLAAMIILFLMENPNSPMAPVKLQNKLRFVADLEMRRMGNSPPEKEKQTGCIGVLMNRTNITGSIGRAAKEMVDPEGILASMAISIIFMLILVIVVIALIVLMDPPENPSARERRQNNIRIEGDMEMHCMGNSPQKKSPVPMESEDVSVIRT